MPRLSPKSKGELAELRFLCAAASRRLIVAKPWGDSLPFDFLVGTADRFFRVQVKSTSAPHCRGYHLCCFRPGTRAGYSGREIDFLAAYVVPADTWYIIPHRALGGRKTITLFPDRAESSWEHFREAWYLLASPLATRHSRHHANRRATV